MKSYRASLNLSSACDIDQAASPISPSRITKPHHRISPISPISPSRITNMQSIAVLYTHRRQPEPDPHHCEKYNDCEEVSTRQYAASTFKSLEAQPCNLCSTVFKQPISIEHHRHQQYLHAVKPALLRSEPSHPKTKGVRTSTAETRKPKYASKTVPSMI